MITDPVTQTAHNGSTICPACRQRAVRCRGLCKNCRRQVKIGMLPEIWLAPRYCPDPPRNARPALTIRRAR